MSLDFQPMIIWGYRKLDKSKDCHMPIITFQIKPRSTLSLQPTVKEGNEVSLYWKVVKGNVEIKLKWRSAGKDLLSQISGIRVLEFDTRHMSGVFEWVSKILLELKYIFIWCVCDVGRDNDDNKSQHTVVTLIFKNSDKHILLKVKTISHANFML